MSQLMTHVVDTATNAVTRFDNYAFNSFTQFQGKYLAAGPDGISLIDDAASTEVILASMTTAILHFGSEHKKRVTDFYLAMRSKGDIVLVVTVDEGDPYEYTLSPYDIETLRQRRCIIGKGLTGKYWEFTLEMSEDFDFDTMNIAAVISERRI